MQMVKQTPREIPRTLPIQGWWRGLVKRCSIWAALAFADLARAWTASPSREDVLMVACRNHPLPTRREDTPLLGERGLEDRPGRGVGSTRRNVAPGSTAAARHPLTSRETVIRLGRPN